MIVEDGAFRIVGAMRLSDFYPAFALAVAVRGTEPGFWLQVLGSNTQRVIGFAPLAETDDEDVQPLEETPIRLGGAYVHAFIDKRGGLLLGTADALRVELGVAMRDAKTSAPVKLEISEHLGDARGAKELRSKLTTSVARAFGQSAGSVFGDSVARTRLWEMVEGLAANPDALARIRKLRPRLVAHADNAGGIWIDLSALDPSDVTVSFEEVAARMQAEFGKGLGPEGLRRADLSGLSNIADPTGQTIVEAMTRSPRQEERLAILLRAMILNPEAAERALSRYKDPAVMARTAMELFAGAMSTIRATPEQQRPERLAPEIMRTIKSAYPRRRGAILYYFAEHLSDFPVIERLLRSITADSRAQAISVLRPHILAALGRKNSRVSR